jgi:hypothetical protein
LSPVAAGSTSHSAPAAGRPKSSSPLPPPQPNQRFHCMSFPLG